MKTLFLLSSLIFSSAVSAATVTLDPFDQQKLANLIHKLPQCVKERTDTEIDKPAAGLRVNNVFKSGPLKIDCNSLYYGLSPHATRATCKVHLNTNSSAVLQKNAETQVTIKDPEVVKAFYQAIPYGKPEKTIYGWERDHGLNIDGYKAPIFHFMIGCTKKLCRFKFSSQKLVP